MPDTGRTPFFRLTPSLAFGLRRLRNTYIPAKVPYTFKLPAQPGSILLKLFPELVETSKAQNLRCVCGWTRRLSLPQTDSSRSGNRDRQQQAQEGHQPD